MTETNITQIIFDAETKQRMFLAQIRIIRNDLLSISDKSLFLTDIFSVTEIDEIKDWRQQLRDLPDNVGVGELGVDLFNYFPAPPSVINSKIGVFSSPILQSLCRRKFPVPVPPDASTKTK